MNKQLLFILLVVLFASCKKDDSPPPRSKTPGELLTQLPWKLVAYGFDLNGNNIIDGNENVIIDCLKDNTYVFNASGTGSISDNSISCGQDPSTDFNWMFLNNNSKLEISQAEYFVLKLDEKGFSLMADDPGLSTLILEFKH
jgi:hypothetical protein